MKFANPPTYNDPQLEDKARKLLDQRLGADFVIPIDVELVLERLQGVVLDFWPALKANHQVEGMVCRDTATGELCVFIDEELYRNRSRMTVAEELGHIVLHRSVIEQVASPEDFLELQRHPLWHRMDRNAKRFAAAVLMPGDKVVEEAAALYPKLVRVAGFGHPQAIINQLAAQLAKRFEVSPQTMGYRLKEYPMKLVQRVEEAMKDGLDYL